MNNTFSSQTLAEKLTKLNNSQQSIETLSHWCIFHRKNAKEIVETWGKHFNSSQHERKESFLYLANDILQNSRRKGREFVNEFWKVLPEALKSVFEIDDDHGKNVVMRLVDIWDERKVFGSRGQGLRDDILGKTPPPPPPEINGKSPNQIKVVRKDALSLRIKLAVGGMPEKIVTAYQSVLDGYFNEDAALNNFEAAVLYVGKMEKDVDGVCTQGIPHGSPLMYEVQEQETILRQCIERLESVEATRAALVAQLKEALQEQESKLELIHTQLQVARSESERATTLKQRIISAMINPIAVSSQQDRTPLIETNPPSSQPLIQPLASLSAEEQHKKAAAALAAMLAASTSSAEMLTSALSSLAAEEAASKNGSSMGPPGVFAGSPPFFPVDKRPKLEKPMPVSDMNNPFFGQMSTFSAASWQPSPSPPPLPPMPPPPMQQYLSYGFGGNALPPPPLTRPGVPPPPSPRFQPPGYGFYGQLQTGTSVQAPGGSIANQGSTT